MTTYSITGHNPSLRTKGFKQLFNWFLVSRQRNRLARLDDRALDDMGLTRADVAHELKRPVWDVPCHWRG